MAAMRVTSPDASPNEILFYTDGIMPVYAARRSRIRAVSLSTDIELAGESLWHDLKLHLMGSSTDYIMLVFTPLLWNAHRLLLAVLVAQRRDWSWARASKNMAVGTYTLMCSVECGPNVMLRVVDCSLYNVRGLDFNSVYSFRMSDEFMARIWTQFVGCMGSSSSRLTVALPTVPLGRTL